MLTSVPLSVWFIGVPVRLGGDDVVLPYAGKDITEAMVDESEHVHSNSAFEMMHDVSFLYAPLLSETKSGS